MRCDGLFDCSVQVEGHRISAHRSVLAASSAVLRKMIVDKRWQDSLNNTRQSSNAHAALELSGMDGSTALTLVEAMYEGSVKLSGATVVAVVAAADMLAIDPVVSCGCRFVRLLPHDIPSTQRTESYDLRRLVSGLSPIQCLMSWRSQHSWRRLSVCANC